jgi:hypothetical protein
VEEIHDFIRSSDFEQLMTLLSRENDEDEEQTTATTS